MLEERNGRPWFRINDEKRSDRQQEGNSEGCGVGRFRRNRERQRVVRRWVGCVVIGIRLVVVIIMAIVMGHGAGDRSVPVVKMPLNCEMDGDEIDVEREEQRGEQTPTPARLTWRGE